MPAKPEHAVTVLNTVAEHAAEALYLMDAEGRVVFMNPAAERMFGWTREEALGKILHDLVHYVHADGTPFPMDECPLGKVMRTGAAARDHEDAFIHRAGHRVPVLCSNAPVIEHGTITGAVLIVHDLTERRRRDRDEKRRAEFDQLLVGMVSHDLRTPVGAIMMGAATLMQKDLDARAKATVGRIISSAARAERMLRDLLDFTKARVGGGIPIHPDEIDLGQLVHEVVAEVGLNHAERAVEVEISGDSSGTWDADRLAQIVTNLLENALVYSHADSSVSIRVVGEARDVVLTVHNEGDPIAPETLGRIFKPLQRGNVRRSGAARRSVGLGLYIVRHLVEAHRGTIEVSSTATDGTVFTVRLPKWPAGT